jgi:hypothetical protein
MKAGGLTGWPELSDTCFLADASQCSADVPNLAEKIGRLEHGNR